MQSFTVEWVLFMSWSLFNQKLTSGNSELRCISSSNCVCPGHNVTFECNVVGEVGSSTVWRGNAFNCNISDNEIALLHNRFNKSSGLNMRTCNNGTIVGWSLRNTSDTYTSRLNVTFNYDTFTIINYTSAFPLPPDDLHISHINLGSSQLVFSWSPVALECPRVHYVINQSNCGSCSTVTNYTSVTCTDVPTDERICTFAVRTVICGDMVGHTSNSIAINLTKTMMLPPKNLKVMIVSLPIFIAGVASLLTTLLVILFCFCVCVMIKRNPTKVTLRLNNIANGDCDRTFSSRNHRSLTSRNKNKDVYGYSQLVETPLDVNSLQEKLQGQVSKQWYQFGLTLGLPIDVLEGFNLYSEDGCLVEVLDYWLKHHPGKPTWQEVTDAQKTIETFNSEQNSSSAKTVSAEEKAVDIPVIPPPKPPRRTTSVTMKTAMTPPTNKTSRRYSDLDYKINDVQAE